MKEVTRSAGITHIADLDAVLAVGHCRKLELRIPFSPRQVVTIGDFISIGSCDTNDRIQIRSQSTGENFHTHSLTSGHGDSEKLRQHGIDLPSNAARQRDQLAGLAIIAFGGNGDGRKIIDSDKCRFGTAVICHDADRVNSRHDICGNGTFHCDRLILRQILPVFRTQHTDRRPEAHRPRQLFAGDDNRRNLAGTQVAGSNAINDRILSDGYVRDIQSSRNDRESRSSDSAKVSSLQVRNSHQGRFSEEHTAGKARRREQESKRTKECRQSERPCFTSLAITLPLEVWLRCVHTLYCAAVLVCQSDDSD